MSFISIHTWAYMYILRHCLWIPKFNYYMRCCPFWKYDNICESFDNSIKLILENLINIKLTPSSWIQASLPIAFGGLGIRAVSDVALPAFLASIHATLALINSILPPSLFEFECKYLMEARDSWLSKFPNPPEPSYLSSSTEELGCINYSKKV